MQKTLYRTDLKEVPLIKRGKVRDIYEVDGKLLIVATDRISCFDVVLPTPIPDKGKVLTLLSCFWFSFTKDIIDNHFISAARNDLPPLLSSYQKYLWQRFMLVQKVTPLPIECIVRGYLAGSGFSEYKKKQAICGISLPAGLKEADKLEEPIFTPSHKADFGHDENITQSQACELVGRDVYEYIKAKSIALYKKASFYAEQKGIIIADTKFEFGFFGDKLILIDEILTPDSSRFWDRNDFEPGKPPKNFDKQFVRDYLLSTGWDKTPPAPQLPDNIVEKTKEKYLGALSLLSGKTLKECRY